MSIYKDNVDQCIPNPFFMSLVIVKASAITIYQNRTTDTTANDQTVDSSNNLSQFQATTSEFITTPPNSKYLSVNYDPQINKENLTITNHIIRTNIIVGAEGGVGVKAGGRGGVGEQGLTAGDFKENFSKPNENMRAKLQQLLQRENDNDDEEKQQLQLDLQQQMQEQLQQQMQQQQQLQQQQHQQYQQSQHAILTGENAYLLERIDGSMHEQPIYGTWSAKARRPQAPLLAQQQHQHHHYERLPRRSSTMTPVRRELHDQIPRPPRLTSRQPSVALRRQFSDTPFTSGSFRDESRPKPFHYPFDGPLPEEFKKLQQSERGVIPGLESDSQVHNIQDILQKLNLGSGNNKVPPLMMMPSGLHISGSYKNLKSSGIGNFFRGKRNKKQIQMQFPMPIPMQMIPNPYQTPVINLMQQPYQQRIAMEQFYPFKPRTPGDINLLAMQQQQQQKFKNPHSKGKKQKKKQKDKKNSLASSNLMMQQYPFVTAAPEMIFPSMYSPYMSINVTQAPPLQMSKRVPFKVNLDIFPVMPPSKTFKSPAGYAMDEARIVSTMRPPTVLRNPFMEYLTTPITPSAAAALNFYNPYNPKPAVYNPMRFPSGAPNPVVSMAQTNNMQMVYPEQLQKYLQQQQQQTHFTNYLNNQGHQTPFLPIDCDQPIPSGASSSQSTSGNSKTTNPIMVHLNVFPKQKAATPLSTNPFYSNVPHIQRNTIQEENESSLSPIEPRHQGRSLNDSVHTKIERSDSGENIQQIQPLREENDLVDFDHPIVAENSDDNNELPQTAALVGGKPNMTSESSSSSFYYESRPNTTMTSGGDNSNTNYNGNMNGNMEQMVSEARTASLFRFPVEDLIQFQVHDAM
ncbi:probable basic-leucine zipper transcription factor N [Calliphora vicina]|uniref:probable basic-leucine zipper transcription factor N n=1 Tax=Calliphora vicina TaxID=7373 RepID=UPI00325ABA02